MIPFLFDDKENKLLSKIEKANSSELMYWKLPNIVYPMFVIFLSLVCYFVFKPNDKFTWIAWVNIIFNGSLPMIALNRIGSMGINLFKYDKSKEKVFETDTGLLRVKIDEYSKILLIVIALFYIFQVIKGPFEFSWYLIVQIIISVLLIKFALKFSKCAYLLQDRLLERSLGDEIRDDAKEVKKGLSQKYGE
ncbi:hypothetical protein [Spirosoma fluviale]|uniref:Uncharacterized protein n=1 Tax=Spirosoma fluviale TaxID=1597977 RepID=A0A286G096_9BACT|nr:hypothetical protein [Spirosoma fluviale]SOD88950.1 hypothetical protein SAMN06269250_2900 [Spirosoma fluviale]